jgi:hypothetical protein
MPEVKLATLHKTVLTCNTGPGAGLTNIGQSVDGSNPNESINRASVVADVVDWCRPHPRSDGLSVTLYEKKLDSSEHHGDPIADAFAVVTRPNSSILALADGINWGIKPRLAARAAILGAIEHLHQKLFNDQNPPATTRDIFHHILLAFDEGHKKILLNEGTTTTLTVAMVCEILPDPRIASRWVLCVVSVGDSPCFLYKPDLHVIYEVTSAARMGKGRDPRDAGGCLGANLGTEPDLSNLICCFLPIADEDIIFLTSDGVSDNFDPVILKLGLENRESVSPTSPPPPPFPPSNYPKSDLPLLSPKDRQDYLTRQMAQLIRHKQERIEHKLSVQDVVESLVSHVVDVTDIKRSFLEKVWIETSDPSLSPNSRRYKERGLAMESKSLPGKLDHTTVVGYQVGELVITPKSSPFSLKKSSKSSNDVFQSLTTSNPGVQPSAANDGSRVSPLSRVGSMDINYIRIKF